MALLSLTEGCGVIILMVFTLQSHGFHRRVWCHNPHGFYTSKSWLSLKKVGFGPHRAYWRTIWKLKMLPKIRVFSWRVGHNILPTYDDISRIRQNFSKNSPRCKNREETLIHALKDCPSALAILTFGGLDNRLIEGSYEWCIDWLEDVLRALDVKATADFFTLLWNCWNNRNNWAFNGKDDEARVVWERA
ncbi:hypothetical protein J1N35_014182 [Gossypium stocksii]|uniref:Reverse transcriptase zinc-binding domain-containing protein n=1 Tax=Gossypium stocksii TaxID=47602 RepID=A0A9D3VW18_9ROSI|nr:hypothetical protein J1N35_014182 [Gossypium stocksii]